MKIGITYDLRDEYLQQGFSEEETAEFDREETILAIEQSLLTLGYRTELVGNIKDLCEALVKGKRWDMVFNICEGMHGIGREAQVPALLDAWNIPYVFSDPLVLALTLHKGLTKRVIRDAGIPTADFFVVEKEQDIEKVNLPYPLFAKPVAEGTGKGITSRSIIQTPQQLDVVCRCLLDKFKQPVLVETFLPGREFTVGIIGHGEEARCLGVMEILLNDQAEQEVYSYSNKEDYEEKVDYRLVAGSVAEACERVALDAWRELGAKDAGRVDLRMDAYEIPNFIEVNPLAGLNPQHSDLPILSRLNGISFTELIAKIMDFALQKHRMYEESRCFNQ